MKEVLVFNGSFAFPIKYFIIYIVEDGEELVVSPLPVLTRSLCKVDVGVV